jgi:hypothetical protein
MAGCGEAMQRPAAGLDCFGGFSSLAMTGERPMPWYKVTNVPVQN